MTSIDPHFFNDLGAGHGFRPVGHNRQVFAFMIRHERSDGTACVALARFSNIEISEEAQTLHDNWPVSAEGQPPGCFDLLIGVDGISISPAIRCPTCGDAGRFRDSRWEPVDSSVDTRAAEPIDLIVH